MCTLTWIHHGEGFELFFNRDELRKRAPARPPGVRERAGRRWLSPLDPEGGGTWIGVNEFGLAVALLNGYLPADEQPRDWVTRGELVDGMLDARTTREVEVRLRKRHLERYRSFTLVALEPAQPALIATWDLRELGLDRRRAGHPPICSSSLDASGATAARRALFSELQARHGTVDADLLELFHASHGPQRGPLSPCMHRDDAETQCFTRIRVGAAKVELHYTPGPPCERRVAERVELERVRGV